MMVNGRRAGALALVVVLTGLIPAWGQAEPTPEPNGSVSSGLTVSADGAGTLLSIEGDWGATAFHRTANQVIDARLVEVADSPIRLVLWTEVWPDGREEPYYAISLDGRRVDAVRGTSYLLKVRHGEFDPLAPQPDGLAHQKGGLASVPQVEPSLSADAGTGLFIVQFVTQPLEEFRSAIEELGGTVYQFLANHAHIVKMTPEVRERVEALPYVRWVGPYHPAYRLEEFLREGQDRANELFPSQRYNIQVFEAGDAQKQTVADRIEALGGTIDMADAGKYLLEATLTPEQLFEVVRWDEVLFVDRWSPYTQDMNIVRQIGGADYIETVAGYTGAGVRGEIIDLGFSLGHPDFASRPLIQHTSVDVDAHGTACAGICFGDGTGDPVARGLMPDGQGIVADWDVVSVGTPRYEHTGELVQAPYYAVFQTASVGSSQTTQYTTVSADTDAMLFDFDIVHCQSQSNLGSQSSRPQAWAKNIISGGAVNHYNTLTRTDDCWCYGASIGPASDGRIKPDLCFFYDYTWTTYTTGSGYGDFGGTSGATPSIAGHVGLYHQMWSDGIFGNEVYPPGGGPTGYDVFDNRPHMTTAKAFMINTASQYPFSGTSHDLTRVHQGWGLPDLQFMYNMRDKISFIDETELLGNMESVEYAAYVAAAEPALRVTLVYADPPGLPSSSQHRINDLSLRVTSPSGTFYWGNNGLLAGLWSTAGGSANVIDTVENVFIQNPQAGVWTVQVIASEVNEDGHVETPELDADFALVVSGAFLATCTSEGRITLDATRYACSSLAGIRVVDCDLNTDDQVIETVEVSIESTTEPGGETVLLTETAPETADFRGTIGLSTTDAPGVLQVSHGDTLTAAYFDEDDGSGSSAVVEDTAVVDCVAPQIFNVQTATVEPRSAVVTFNTNEPATGTVRYGSACATLTGTAGLPGLTTDHTVNLTSLDDDTTYYYAVDAEDEAGNVATDDNGGFCYSFTTPDIPNFFTQQFASGNDLDNLSLIFTPDGSPDFYDGCVEAITELPTDPTGGTVISLAVNDYEMLTLAGGATVSLYGATYGALYVGSNGYITFGAGDTDYTESLADHFDLRRISALFDELNPLSGTVSWKQLPDRVAVTWENVAEYGASNSNTFQIEMFFDGIITINYLNVDASDGLAGLSEGQGLSPDYYVTDLSEMGPCEALIIELPGGPPWRVDPAVPTTMAVLIDNGSEAALPASATLHYRFDGGEFLTNQMTYLGGNAYEATLPAAFCDQTPEFYFSAAGDGGTTVYDPVDAPASYYSAVVASMTVVLADDFETDQGWTVVDDPSVETGTWERGLPADDGTEGDPTSDFDGSGQCYLTGNWPGNSDVDGGPTRLITPMLDLSGATNPVVRYARWWSNDDQDGDPFDVEISNDGGQSWTLIERVANIPAGWIERTVYLAGYTTASSQMQIRFSASDVPNNSKDEAGLDAVTVFDLGCRGPGTGDYDGDGDVDLADCRAFQECYNGPATGDCASAFEFVGNGQIDLDDLAKFVPALTGPSK